MGTETCSRTLLEAASLDGVQLRNRVLRAGCFEGMSRNGRVTDALPGLRQLVDAVHAEGAAASLQLVHCGYFADPKVIGGASLGASAQWCLYRMARCRAMGTEDIERVVAAFAQGASLAREAGFDAVEVHAGHGYLLSQFLSPLTNHRTDGYGGDLAGRARLAVEVVRAVREAVGPDAGVLVKMNTEDGAEGGLGVDDAVEAAKLVADAGAGAIVPSCGLVAQTSLYMLRGYVPFREMALTQKGVLSRMALRLFGRYLVKQYPYKSMFLKPLSHRLVDAVSVPVVYVGGATDKDEMQAALDEGFGFVQIGRATIRDPQFVNKLSTGVLTASDCDHCNRCVAAMDDGGVYCVSDKEGLLQWQ